MQQIEILRNDEGMRLDRFLKKYLPLAKPSLLYKSIRKKNITVNGQKTEEKYILKLGDWVEIYFSDATIEKFQEDRSLKKGRKYPDILFETEDILIIDKPAGMLSHGAGGKYEDNVVDNMIAYLIDTGAYIPRLEKTFTPAVCNRLDRNTSGLIIGAKTAYGLKECNRLLRERRIGKYYQTIVSGHLSETRKVVSHLKKDEERNRVAKSVEGKEAIGIYRPLAYGRDATLVEVDLITGRTHQIRYQLASIGHPVLGDRKYGGGRTAVKGEKVDHQLLHCYKLVFPPLDGKLEALSECVFTVEAEESFQKIWKELQ